MTKHYNWLLFDADGTLFDYDRGEVTPARLRVHRFEQLLAEISPGAGPKDGSRMGTL